MSVDRPDVAQPRPPVPPSAAATALASYHARLRPWRIAYAAAIAVVVLVALVVVKIAYNHGEISHATLRTAQPAAAPVPLSEPSASPTRAWNSPDATAIGTPYWNGTVITYSAHSVNGRDGRTGAVRWSYTRTDRTVCQAVQMSGTTIAIYELNGNCDELTAFDSGTGVRKWTRTLDKDGHELNGRPTYQVGAYTLLVSTPQVIYAIDPASSYDRWEFAQVGCTINRAVLGSAGVLISQTCTAPQCSDKMFCGKGPQLLLRDPTAGTSDDGKNPDQIKWNLIGNTALPVAADSFIGAGASGSDRLDVLDVAKGKTLSSLSLDSAIDADASAQATANTELIRTGGTTYAINPGGTRISWSTATTAMPTVTAADGSTNPTLSTAYVAVSTATGIDLLAGTTGAVSRSFAVAPPAAGSRPYPFGTGFVVAGSSTVVYR